MFVFVYSSYHLRLSFTHLAVILTTPEIANIRLRSQARICGHYHEPSDCFEYPKKYLPNVPTQKNPWIRNFKPKNILRSSPSLEIRSTSLGYTVCTWIHLQRRIWKRYTKTNKQRHYTKDKINQGVKKSKGEETTMKKAFDFNNKNKE